MAIEVTQYVRENGKCPFAVWFDSLDPQAAAKVRVAVIRMEQGNLGDSKSVGERVWERRLHFGSGYRMYYGRDGAELVILLAGGTKRRQQSDVAYAKELWAEYRRRKKGA
jgi:putative addiction module killer protein